MNKVIAIRLSAALFLLLSGMVPYIMYRQGVYFLSPFSTILPDVRPMPTSMIGQILIYNFPDGAWYGALLCVVSAIPRDDAISKATFYISVMLPYILELSQFFGLISGTFDVKDIAIYVIITVIHIICVNLNLTKP